MYDDVVKASRSELEHSPGANKNLREQNESCPSFPDIEENELISHGRRSFSSTSSHVKL